MPTSTWPLWEAVQQPLPIYHHCTLQEILLLGSSIVMITSLTLPLISALCFGYGLLGLVLAFPLSFVLTRIGISKLAKRKLGKPRGFYQQHVRYQLARLGVYRLPYVTRLGRWSL